MVGQQGICARCHGGKVARAAASRARKEKVVGYHGQDGNKSDLFGPNPQGQVTFDPNGRRFIITRSDLPKFASNNRRVGTPEENKAVVQGSIAYFGTYSVNERDKTVATHIEGGTFPNWIGTDQKRLFSTPRNWGNVWMSETQEVSGREQRRREDIKRLTAGTLQQFP